MKTRFDPVVARLERHRGVSGVMVVGLDDGMVIAADAAAGAGTDAAAALASSLFRRTRICAEEARVGRPRFVLLEAERGQLCAAGNDDVVIVTIASAGANLGRLRLEMLNSLEAL